MANLIRINFEKGELITPKHRYKIADSKPVEKYIEFERLQCEVAYGYSFEEINRVIIAAIGHLNKADFVQAAVLMDNLRNSIKNGIEKRESPIVRLCMLFLIREDENEKEYSETFHKEKYNDVTSSGVDYQDFFSLAINTLPGLLQAYREVSQATSQETAKMIQELSQSEILKGSTGNSGTNS